MEKSNFNPQYVDIHGYLQWNILAFETYSTYSDTTGEYEQNMKFDEIKYHRCTDDDRK